MCLPSTCLQPAEGSGRPPAPQDGGPTPTCRYCQLSSWARPPRLHGDRVTASLSLTPDFPGALTPLSTEKPGAGRSLPLLLPSGGTHSPSPWSVTLFPCHWHLKIKPQSARQGDPSPWPSCPSSQPARRPSASAWEWRAVSAPSTALLSWGHCGCLRAGSWSLCVLLARPLGPRGVPPPPCTLAAAGPLLLFLHLLVTCFCPPNMGGPWGSLGSSPLSFLPSQGHPITLLRTSGRLSTSTWKSADPLHPGLRATSPRASDLPLGVPHIPPNSRADLTALPRTPVFSLLLGPLLRSLYHLPSKHQAPSSTPSPRCFICFASSSVNVPPHLG